MINKRAIFHQSLAVTPLCLSEFVMGIGFGWISPMMKSFLEDPDSEIVATEEECSWIASLGEFGRIFGPIFSIILLDKLGSKLLLQLAATTFFIMWCAILFTRSVLVLCITMFVFGLSIGLCNVISAVYLGENCSPKIRGNFCSASVTCCYLGVLLGYMLCAYFSYNVIAVIGVMLGLSCLCSTFLLVESPQFLIFKGRLEEAESNLMWLNGTKNKDDIVTELEHIKSYIASEKKIKTSYKELFLTRANYKSLIIVLILNMSHAGTGNSSLFIFVATIFQSNDSISSNEFTMYFGILQLLSCFLCTLVIEKYDRRTMMLLCFGLFLLSHSVSTYFSYAEVDFLPKEYVSWIIFSSVCTYSGFSAIMDSVIHMIRGELFPHSIKSLGSSSSIMAHSFVCFITVKIFLAVKTQYGLYMNFLLYGVVTLVGFWFSYFTLPETRGKTLIEIQKFL